MIMLKKIMSAIHCWQGELALQDHRTQMTISFFDELRLVSAI